MEDKLKELMKDELVARGYEIRRQAFSDAVVEADAAVRMNDEFQRPMWQHGVRAAWGLLWSRPDLDARYVAPSTAVQAQLVAIWANVLRLEHVGVNDNFFELCFDSILSIQVIAQASQA